MQRLLAYEEVQAKLRELEFLYEDWQVRLRELESARLAVKAGAESLSADVELLTPAEIERYVQWRLRHPGEPILVSYLGETTEKAPRRARVRSEATVERALQSLRRKAAGMSAAEADDAADKLVPGVPETREHVAISRKRLRDDSRPSD